MTTRRQACDNVEPWGRYSASGGIFSVGNNTDTSHYLYSFGGDTLSDADGRGGVVRTNFRYNLATHCWERLADAPVAVGYRATATQTAIDDAVYLLAGADATRAATNDVHRYSLLNDTWTRINVTTTAKPLPRWKHAAVSLGDGRSILVTGGRGNNRVVHQDAWVFDTVDHTWALVPTAATEMPALYRHGMAWDTHRQLAWLHGGLDETLTRRDSVDLWQLNVTSGRVEKVEPSIASTPPPQLASHAMEYIPHLDVLLLWGGTCADDSELYIYEISTRSWCRILPAFRPDRRDAMLWSLQYPLFYVATGDIICYNRQVLTIADVHVLDLSKLDSWQMLYEPFNSRGTGNEAYCDGSNAGSCQPTPLLADTRGYPSTCSADLLSRFTSTAGSETLTTTWPSPMPATSSGAIGGAGLPCVLLLYALLLSWLTVD